MSRWIDSVLSQDQQQQQSNTVMVTINPIHATTRQHIDTPQRWAAELSTITDKKQRLQLSSIDFEKQ